MGYLKDFVTGLRARIVDAVNPPAPGVGDGALYVLDLNNERDGTGGGAKVTLVGDDVGIGGGEQHTEGVPVGPTTKGTLALAKDPSGNTQHLLVDASGNLKSSGGVSVTESSAIGPLGVPIVGRDENGNALYPLVAADHRTLVTMSYPRAIGSGHVVGHKKAIAQTGGTIPLPGWTLLVPSGTFNEPAAAGQWSIVSSSASDSPAGGGIEAVKIEFMRLVGGAYVEATEYIALNGVTPVNLAALDCYRINEIEQIAPAGNLGAVGAISVMSAPAGGGVVVAQIPIGAHEAPIPALYTPDGKYFHLDRVRHSGDDRARFRIFTYKDYSAEDPLGAADVPHMDFDLSGDKGSAAEPVGGFLVVPPNSKLLIYVDAYRGGGDYHTMEITGWYE